MPKIAEILNNISSTLDMETVTGLNAKVDVDGQEYEAVAKEYFDSIK
ncbi:MAG: glycine betaine ABC transporter substrate-binding protein [Trichococcus flocculiformis]